MKKYVIICALCSSLGNAAIVKSSSLFNIDGSAPDTLILAAAGDTLSFGFASSGVFSLSDTQVSTFASAQDVNSLIPAFNGFIGSDDFQTGVDFLFGTGDISGAYAFQSASFDPTSVIGQSLFRVKDGRFEQIDQAQHFLCVFDFEFGISRCAHG